MTTAQSAHNGEREYPRVFYATIRVIDGLNNLIGKIVSLGMLFLVLSISYEQ